MATKTAVHNKNAPDFRSMFNWGLKITNFSELFLLAGLGAHTADFQIQHGGDAAGQTRYILNEVKRYLEESGYSLNDVIRIEFTLHKDVPAEDYEKIFGIFAEVFTEINVKPAAGTLRIVEGLALPGMLVEYEFWAAK